MVEPVLRLRVLLDLPLHKGQRERRRFPDTSEFYVDLIATDNTKFNSKGSSGSIDPIAILCSKLQSIESALQFEGKPYPDPLVPFPWQLTGRGFFPGGDGMWREPIPKAIIGPPTNPYPYDGIMFVGQDFGSLEKYPPKIRPWELDNVATWKFLTERIKQSGVPGASSFFTNALLGLRKEGSTIGQNQCVSIPRYAEVCRDFLAFQIEILDPRLIIGFQSVNRAI